MGEAAEHPESTPARSWLRRAARALVGTALLACCAVQLPAVPAYAAAGSGSDAATVQVDSLTPAVPARNSTLRVSGTVTNSGSAPLTHAHVALRLGSGGPLTSRSAISDTAGAGGFSPAADGAEVAGHTADLPDIGGRLSEPFTLDVPVGALHLQGNGVYQLAVTVSGRTSGADYTHVLGITRTFLPWYAQDSGKKTRTTFLWPLVDEPRLEIRTPGDGQQGALMRDDALAAELAPGGRLQQLVALGKDLPVTWVIDPDLLATVDEMTRPYRVDGPGGDTTRTTPGTGTAYAKQWLNDLQAAVQGKEVIALPFGDPDIASIADHGRNVTGTIGHLRAATDLASTTVQTVLGVTPRTDFAWPIDGAIDPEIVGVATAGGASKIIARSDSLKEAGTLSYTPSAARPIGAGTTAVVADAALSTAFTGDMTRADNFTLAVQQFLAQSLMIHEQAPQLQRNIVITPQRMPTAYQAQAMAAAISAMNGGNWSEPASLDSAAEATPDPGANRAVPSSSAYPGYLRRQELGTAAFQQVQTVQDSLNSFLVILSRKDRATAPFGTAILRSMSDQWRGSSDGAAAFRNDVESYLDDLTQAVRIVPKQSITLSGRSATIPVTVQNNLAQQVSLELQLTSNQSNRLNPGKPQEVDIDGGHNRSLKFPTTASANGRVWVTAQLFTKDGTPYGPPVVFQVNVTSLTATVMLVIGGGLLLLMLAGVRMYRQRKRAVARRALEDACCETAPGEPPAKTGTPAAGPAAAPQNRTKAAAQQPGDPGEDTAAEEPKPPSAGEKVDR